MIFKVSIINIIVLLILLFSSLSSAKDIDYDSLQLAQATSAAGFIWIKMTTKEKSAYLMGYEDGYLNALGYYLKDKKIHDEAISKLPSFYDASEADTDKVWIPKLDEFYGHDLTIENIPIPLAIRLIIDKEKNIKSDIDIRQKEFYDNMVEKIVEDKKSTDSLSDNTPPVRIALNGGTRYTLQAATYGNEEYARQDALLLKAKGFQSFLIKRDKYWLLCIGNFNNKESAIALLQKLPGQYQQSQVRRF